MPIKPEEVYPLYKSYFSDLKTSLFGNGAGSNYITSRKNALSFEEFCAIWDALADSPEAQKKWKDRFQTGQNEIIEATRRIKSHLTAKIKDKAA